jgi:hypothetical protein
MNPAPRTTIKIPDIKMRFFFNLNLQRFDLAI